MKSRDRVVQNFGQLFIMAFDGLHFTEELVEFFKTFRIGGLILFSDNFESPRQLQSLIDEIQDRCRTDAGPLLITTDHEGGKIQQFRRGFSVIPPLSVMGQGTPQETLNIHRAVSRELHKVGVNLNFAPVADLCAAGTEGSIGNRSFGENPVAVAEHVASAVKGLQMEGVLACAKHFPGHGATTKSSHVELPVIELTIQQLAERDLLPFRAAIEAGVASIMTAHVVFTGTADPRWPASLSSFWLMKTLRDEMGFDGTIITDSLEMKAMTNHWHPVESGFRALTAGADILLYYREKTQFQAFYELRCRLEKGELDVKQISESLERVRALKAKIRS